MKKLLLFLSLFVGVMFLSGCASDGADGKAFLSFDWDWYTDWYDDNNSSIPDANTWGYPPSANFEVSPGTYNFEYGCSDGNGNAWIIDGTYTITVNPGESGSWFTDGADGADNYFRFNLYGMGPEFGLLKTNKVKSLLNANTLDMSLYEKVAVGEVVTEVQNSVNGTMVIKKQMYKLELK